MRRISSTALPGRTSQIELAVPVADTALAFIWDVTAVMMAGRGDELPVSVRTTPRSCKAIEGNGKGSGGSLLTIPYRQGALRAAGRVPLAHPVAED
ncbi:MAG: hypothetical protein ACR2Q4_15760 [Geminicoccaceae bacterium]